MAVTLHLPVFQLSDLEHQNFFGWSFTIFTVLTIIVNIQIILRKLAYKIYLLIVMIFNNKNFILKKIKNLWKTYQNGTQKEYPEKYDKINLLPVNLMINLQF